MMDDKNGYIWRRVGMRTNSAAKLNSGSAKRQHLTWTLERETEDVNPGWFPDVDSKLLEVDPIEWNVYKLRKTTLKCLQ